MASLKVVFVGIAINGYPDFLDVVLLHQIGFLILERSEPPLNLDVVSPSALVVHALPYMVFLENPFVLLDCELATPIEFSLA